MASAASESSLDQLRPTTSTSPAWPAISRQLKQGVKTGLAGLIAYVIYAHFQLREGYWAVFAALIVTQANLGASWQAALYRTVGTTAGALSAALLAAMIGVGPVRAGVLLFILASFFAYLTTRHATFSTAGFTVALVLFFSHSHEYWHLAWARVLYTVMGAFIAFAVGVLVWPVRARDGLRAKISLLLEDCSHLTRLITEGALCGELKEKELEELTRAISQHRRDITQSLEESRSEPARSRFDHDAYVSFVEELDHLRLHLLTMSRDSATYAGSGIPTNFVPSLVTLCERISEALLTVAVATTRKSQAVDLTLLTETVAKVNHELTALREARVTAPFTLDRMLPFWSFVFNMKQAAAELQNLQQKLPQLS